MGEDVFDALVMSARRARSTARRVWSFFCMASLRSVLSRTRSFEDEARSLRRALVVEKDLRQLAHIDVR